VDTVIHANSAATSFHVKDYDTASLALVLAQKANVKILEFRLMRPRLEDIFMQITGQRYTSNYSSPEKAKGTR
jgi:hypothetical protein